jgi:serine phosphatase RsbU (regulator of sigma subunit)
VIALTVFRYDPKLTAFTGGYAVLLYGCLWVYVGQRTTIGWGGYSTELFTPNATVIGQATKMLILIAFVSVAAYVARDTRSLLHRLVRREVRVRSENQALERELELASLVQTQLLPRHRPPIGGLHLYGAILPGRYVGGDYYDFIERSENTVLLVVADVAGKGLPAALTMSAVRASVHLFTSMSLGLREMMDRLNTLLYDSTSPDAYVTLFAAEINRAQNSITYVNAGHPPPLLLHSHGGVSRLASTTVPLGMFPTLPGLQAAAEQFFPGSTLVACTDGVWERTNSAGELYGDSGLVGFLTGSLTIDCATFVGRLLEQVREFGGKRPFEDDVTVAVARFEPARAE